MTNPIRLKRSAVPGKVPTLVQLPAGELALNTADKRLFFSSGDAITQVANVTDLTFANVTDKPTTLGGFGILDAYTKVTVDSLLSNKLDTSTLGEALGAASLGVDGKILATQMPAIAVTDTFVVASQSAMLALTGAEVGDLAVRTDLNQTFILKATGYAVLANWQELLTPTDTVTSVNGMAGAVTVTNISGNAGTAAAWQTARSLNITGAAVGTTSFSGTADANLALTLADSGIVAGSYAKPTFNAKGIAVGSTALVSADIPELDWTKIAAGKPTTLAGYGITDAIGSDLAAFQARRTTTLALTTTAVDVAFDSLDYNNQPSVLSRSANTRCNVSAAGVYLVTLCGEVINTTNTSIDYLQIRVNGVALPQGLISASSRSSRETFSRTIPLYLNATDYLTVAASSSAGTTGTIQIGCTLSVVRLQGLQGPAGPAGGQGSVYYSAANLDNPNNSNWAVNALAPVSADSASAALLVRAFDDTAEEGVGFTLYVPPAATQATLTFTGRAATAPATAKTVVPKLYTRQVPVNAAVAAWSAGLVMTALNVPTNAFYQTYTQTISLATLGLVAGQTGQLELTRSGANASDTLAGDFLLLNLTVAFS